MYLASDRAFASSHPVLQVVVVAEDGVSTSRYPVRLLLVQSSAELSLAAAAEANASLAALAATAAHVNGEQIHLNLSSRYCGLIHI